MWSTRNICHQQKEWAYMSCLHTNLVRNRHGQSHSKQSTKQSSYSRGALDKLTSIWAIFMTLCTSLGYWYSKVAVQSENVSSATVPDLWSWLWTKDRKEFSTIFSTNLLVLQEFSSLFPDLVLQSRSFSQMSFSQQVAVNSCWSITFGFEDHSFSVTALDI